MNENFERDISKLGKIICNILLDQTI